MEKTKWKESKCEGCDFCVNRRCRKRPPKGTPMNYPVITDTPACSEFEKRRK